MCAVDQREVYKNEPSLDLLSSSPGPIHTCFRRGLRSLRECAWAIHGEIYISAAQLGDRVDPENPNIPELV
jgi:hypothetical protein